MRLLFLVTEDWYFASHRLELARAALAAGFQVGVATRVRVHGERIREAGIELIPLELARRGKNPWSELRTVRDIAQIYRAFRPDIVHQVALKPILYGTLGARIARVPHVINALTGLGYVFSSDDIGAQLARPLLTAAYRVALRQGQVIVQNVDDLAMLTNKGIVALEQCALIYGAGVDVERFAHVEEPPGPVHVVLPSRMLRDKGVVEFVAAARQLKAQGIRARFVLVGASDPANPGSIAESQLRAWAETGVVEWWGWRDDMADVLREAHIVCLPSYREGLPKSLIEAAASGRPIVTCDVPGCREAVIPDETGILVPARDASALARALGALIGDAPRRQAMGARARQLALEKFSMQRVAAETIDLYRRVMNGTAVAGVVGRAASRT
jgi:glycosyltransferase involved in cell wall biosynthesis